MTVLHLTAHAALRIAQRGMRPDDLEIIHLIGTEVEGGYLVREKDFQALDRALRRFRDRARRLVGKRIVIEGKELLTAYHAERSKQRRLLRTAQDRALVE
jgi:hypothetical protein